MHTWGCSLSVPAALTGPISSQSASCRGLRKVRSKSVRMLPLRCCNCLTSLPPAGLGARVRLQGGAGGVGVHRGGAPAAAQRAGLAQGRGGLPGAAGELRCATPAPSCAALPATQRGAGRWGVCRACHTPSETLGRVSSTQHLPCAALPAARRRAGMWGACRACQTL